MLTKSYSHRHFKSSQIQNTDESVKYVNFTGLSKHNNTAEPAQANSAEKNIAKDWNPNNKLLDRSFVESVIERFCGTYIRIYDLRKYQLAFVHKSVKRKDISPPTEQVLEELANAKIYNTSPEHILERYGTWNNGNPVIFTQDYDQIEFVGDGWIGSIVGEYLYSLFPRQNEGFYTNLKQRIVCTNGLASISKYIGFDKYILLSTRSEMRHGRDNATYLEDAFEAFCAAIKQDLGIPMLILFLKNTIESSMDFEYFITTNTNFKDTLMRFFQSNGWPQPTYPDIKYEVVGYNKIYTCGVEWIPELDAIGLEPMKINGKLVITHATQKKKKDAQKEAAMLALQRIKQFCLNKINK